jgi:hypothetical protein
MTRAAGAVGSSAQWSRHDLAITRKKDDVSE